MLQIIVTKLTYSGYDVPFVVNNVFLDMLDDFSAALVNTTRPCNELHRWIRSQRPSCCRICVINIDINYIISYKTNEFPSWILSIRHLMRIKVYRMSYPQWVYYFSTKKIFRQKQKIANYLESHIIHLFNTKMRIPLSQSRELIRLPYNRLP